LADVAEIGTQARPELFALHVEKPGVLHAAALEVDGRLSAQGEALAPLDEDFAREALRAHADSGLESAAVALIHAHVDGRVEARVASLAREAGFAHVSVSHIVAPEEG